MRASDYTEDSRIAFKRCMELNAGNDGCWDVLVPIATMMSQPILMDLLQKAEDATCRKQAQQIIIHYNLVRLLIEKDRTHTPG